MIWLALAKALLLIVTKIAGYVKDKQLIDAGEAKALEKESRELLERIRKAERIRRGVDPRREL